MNSKLEQKKTELVEERAGIQQDLATTKAALKKIQPWERDSDEYRRLVDEEASLKSDLHDIEAEIRAVNLELRESGSGNPFLLGHVLALVAARISSGDRRPVAELASEAKAQVEEIRRTVHES